MNEVKGTTDKMESHVLLEECLQDHNWVNQVCEQFCQSYSKQFFELLFEYVLCESLSNSYSKCCN